MLDIPGCLVLLKGFQTFWALPLLFFFFFLNMNSLFYMFFFVWRKNLLVLSYISFFLFRGFYVFVVSCPFIAFNRASKVETGGQHLDRAYGAGVLGFFAWVVPPVLFFSITFGEDVNFLLQPQVG